ncbi:MAG TPA: ABC transporter substrate-binding protein [Rhodopila sp.]|nr:ABC transporter substrate-binding protein [Rhodopila sp.]
MNLLSLRGPAHTRRTLFLTTVAALAAAAVLPAAAAEAQPGLDAPLQRLNSALEAVMRAGHNTPVPRRFQELAPVVDQVFDLQTVLRVAVGARWNSLKPETQTRLLDVYRRFIVATYVANFDSYDGERFEILPGARDSGPDRIVATTLVAKSGERQRLDYVLRDENGSWRVVDVLLDGSISRVAVQRSDFRKILAGGDVDVLIANLRHKISDLSDGTLDS